MASHLGHHIWGHARDNRRVAMQYVKQGERRLQIWIPRLHGLEVMRTAKELTLHTHLFLLALTLCFQRAFFLEGLVLLRQAT